MSHVTGNAGDLRSVADIEGVSWPAPPSDTTYLIRRIHELRRLPLSEFTVEDLRALATADPTISG